VTCYSKRFVTDGGRLFEQHPVRAVKFAAFTSTRGAATAKELAAFPQLARVHTLHLTGPLADDEFIDTLGASPHVVGIRHLSLDGCDLSPQAVSQLGRTHVPAARLSGSACFPGVRELDLWSVINGTEWAEALAGSPRLFRLTALRVNHGADAVRPPIRGPGAVALAESPNLRELAELDLRNQDLRKRGAEAFAAAYAWPRLRWLGLRGNGIPASSLPAFAANPHLRSLAEIDFRGNDIKAEHLGPLRAACADTRFLTDDTDHPVRLVLQPEDEP
jgi:hypothetical protein